MPIYSDISVSHFKRISAIVQIVGLERAMRKGRYIMKVYLRRN